MIFISISFRKLRNSSLFRNLAAGMFAPGAAKLAQEFGITSNIAASFTVSIYLLGYVFGPLLLSSMSELYGRLVIYHVCNAFYVAFTIGCALSKNTAMFLVFRFVCGCAASAPMVIGGGTGKGHGCIRPRTTSRAGNWSCHWWLRD